MFDEITKRPALGQCWVCNRRDTVPTDKRDRMPAVCSEKCERGWLALLAFDSDSPATHTVEDDRWVPVLLPAEITQALVDIDEATSPLLASTATRVVPVGPPMPPFPRIADGGEEGDAAPAVDLVVAEAGPPITPVTAAELEACRRDKPPPRPVPGQWLRNVLAGVFR